MAPTDIADPAPRDQPRALPQFTPLICERLILPAAQDAPTTAFGDVLDQRRTLRSLALPSLARIGAWLWHAARTRATAANGWEHRAAPSAGGLHPIEIVVILPDTPTAFVYDAMRHALGRLADADSAELADACAEVQGIVPDARGALVLLAGHSARMDAVYAHPESLIWRDAGCLLAVLQLVAVWLGLGVCPVGALGGNVVQAIRAAPLLVPAGLLFVGEPMA